MAHINSKEVLEQLILDVKKRLGVIGLSLSTDSQIGEFVNKQRGMLSLLDSAYKSDAPSTNYSNYLKAIATESVRALNLLQNILNNNFFPETQGEYLTRNIESWLFPYNIRPNITLTDDELHYFLLEMVEAYFRASNIDNIKESLDSIIQINTVLSEAYILDREIDLFKPENQFVFNVSLNVEDPAIKDINQLVKDISFLLEIIKPAHTKAQIQYDFTSYNNEVWYGTGGYTLAKDNLGNNLISPDGFEIPLKNYNTSMCDVFHLDIFTYYYESLRRNEGNKLYRYKGFDKFNSSFLNSNNYLLNSKGLRHKLNDINKFYSINFDLDNLPSPLQKETEYFIEVIDGNKFRIKDITLENRGKKTLYKELVFKNNWFEHFVSGESSFITSVNIMGYNVTNTDQGALYWEISLGDLILYKDKLKTTEVGRVPSNTSNIISSLGLSGDIVFISTDTFSLENVIYINSLKLLNHRFEETFVDFIEVDDLNVVYSKNLYKVKIINSNYIQVIDADMVISPPYDSLRNIIRNIKALPFNLKTYFKKEDTLIFFNIEDVFYKDNYFLISNHGLTDNASVHFYSGVFKDNLDDDSALVTESLQDSYLYKKNDFFYSNSENYITNDINSLMYSKKRNSEYYSNFYSQLDIESIDVDSERISNLQEEMIILLGDNFLELENIESGQFLFNGQIFSFSAVDTFLLFCSSHGLSDYNKIKIISSNIYNIVVDTDYYVKKIDNDNFKILSQI